MKFEVTVFSVRSNDHDDCIMPETLELLRLGSAVAHAQDSRRAAALGWIALAGRERQKRLIDLNAPEALVESETNSILIERVLVPTSACPGFAEGYLFDNMIETWLIGIEQLPCRIEDSTELTPAPDEPWLFDRIASVYGTLDAVRFVSSN